MSLRKMRLVHRIAIPCCLMDLNGVQYGLIRFPVLRKIYQTYPHMPNNSPFGLLFILHKNRWSKDHTDETPTKKAHSCIKTWTTLPVGEMGFLTAICRNFSKSEFITVFILNTSVTYRNSIQTIHWKTWKTSISLRFMSKISTQSSIQHWHSCGWKNFINRILKYNFWPKMNDDWIFFGSI